MATATATKKNVRINGCVASAQAAKYADVDVIAAYPIRPYTATMMALAQMVANGELDAEYIVADSEHSQLSIAHGASSSGARVFTGSSGVGVQFAYELYSPISGSRMPVQMMIADRTLDPPGDFGSEHTDALSTRDMGWLMGWSCDAQEAFDNHLMAYRIGEDPRVLLPQMVCQDGFFVSHITSDVELPDPGQVKEFLPPYKHPYPLDPRHPVSHGPQIMPEQGPPLQLERARAMEESMPVIEEVHDEFAKIFGRRYDPWVEEFMTDGAEIVFFMQGGHAVTARFAIQHMRERGLKVGLVRLRTIRPYPTDRVNEVLSKFKVVGVIETNMGLGSVSSGGSLYAEVCAALYESDRRPLVVSFMAGMGGEAIVLKEFYWMTEKMTEAQKTRQDRKAYALGRIRRVRVSYSNSGDAGSLRPCHGRIDMATIEVQRQLLPILDSPNQGARFYNPELPSSEPFVPGHRTCAGCGPSIQYRMTSKAAGDNTILVGPTGCMYVANSSYLCTPYNVPWAHTQIGSAGSFTAGVAAAYEAMIRKGKWKGAFPNIICEAGDGSASDIGLASISGALYRNHDCLIICYDNEQYANTGIQASSRTPYGGMTTFSPPGPLVPEAKKLFPKDLARMMAAGHPHCYVATASVGYPIDLMNKVRKGLNHKGAAYLMVYTPCQKGFVYETPRSIDLGRLVVECGLYPIWEWNPEKRAYDYSFRPQNMRPVSEYLKLQGRFGHLHAEHIATLQKFANEQWRMMGVELPEALIQAADAKNLVNMASAEEAVTVAETV